jgi:hypothetical protein
MEFVFSVSDRPQLSQVRLATGTGLRLIRGFAHHFLELGFLCLLRTWTTLCFVGAHRSGNALSTRESRSPYQIESSVSVKDITSAGFRGTVAWRWIEHRRFVASKGEMKMRDLAFRQGKWHPFY